MEKHTYIRLWAGFISLAAALIILILWNINAGSVHLSVKEIVGILFSHTGDNAAIVWNIRLPRIIAALLSLFCVGAILYLMFGDFISGLRNSQETLQAVMVELPDSIKEPLIWFLM